MDILTLSAKQLAQLIRQGELSSYEIVSRHIERAKQVNPVINAIVANRYEQAMQDAKRADEMVRDGEEIGPLHGVPCTIKECFAYEGMPQSSGVVARKNHIATENAPTVQRLLNSGAIPIGVTNTSELCMWYESANKLYGRTRNPYNPRKIVGGSSGGEGAIIGAGASPFGLGSDIGGSIRMPAFFNGIFGHKGSGGLIPNRGQFPSPANPIRFLSTGPLCRKAEDLSLLVSLLKGKDGIDESVTDFHFDPDFEINYTDLNIITLGDIPGKKVQTVLKEAEQKVITHLKTKGARHQTATLPKLSHAFDIWSAAMGQESGKSGYAKLLGYASHRGLYKHLFLTLIRQSPHTFPSIILGLTENTTRWFPQKNKRMLEWADELKQEINTLLTGNSILLFPSHPRVAPSHYVPILHPFAFVYTGILNIAEIPVTQVPLGLGHSGLPLGIQVGAAHGKDHLTIAIARELEKAFGGWVMPEMK
ncbi:MAG: amidase [Candidatus Competibacteraceae bacterium]|nr:amidase [Candidatus Competibacteraceae bacterium]